MYKNEKFESKIILWRLLGGRGVVKYFGGTMLKVVSNAQILAQQEGGVIYCSNLLDIFIFAP